LKALTPILILITSYLLKGKLDSIEEGQKNIQAILIEQGKIEIRLNAVEKDVEDLKTKQTGKTSNIRFPAKNEEMITLNSLHKNKTDN
jgi:hypothetical protein